MIKKGLILVIAVSCYAVSFFWVSQDQPLEMFSKKCRNARILPSITLLKAISGDFNSIISEVYFTYGSVLLGNFDRSSPLEDWEYVYQVLKLSRDLDPYFKDPYRLVQGIYPWIPKMPDKAISFLKKGLAFRTWDGFLPYYIGFDYYFFLRNYKKSANYLFISAKISHNPFMATLASKIAYKGGDVETGITFLTNMYEKTRNGPVRRSIRMRLEALKGVQLLQKAINKYKKIYGERPLNLEELVTKGIIQKMPGNPYKTPYRLEKGRIRFD